MCVIGGGGGGGEVRCSPEVRSTRATGVTCMLYPYVCYFFVGGGGGVQPRGPVNQGNWCYMHAVSLCRLF